MRKQHSLLHFIFGFGIGAVVGFVLRNMESTEYNTGYQPKTEVFKEDDYFTDDVIKQHQEEKAARHLAREADASKIAHVPQYKEQSSDVHDNVEVMSEKEHIAEHSDTQMTEIHVPQYRDQSSDVRDNVEVMSEEEHIAEHNSDAQTPDIHVPQYKEDIATDACADVETIPAEEHEAMHGEAPEEAVEGTVEEIADDGVSEGLEALKEVVEDHEDC